MIDQNTPQFRKDFKMSRKKIILRLEFLFLLFYYVFHGRVTLFSANNSLMQCRITVKFLHIFF